MRDCAICRHLGEPPRRTANVVGLSTEIAELLAAGDRERGLSFGEEHVMLPACSQHVVDLYQGRVPGVAMAWRLATWEPLAGGPPASLTP